MLTLYTYTLILYSSYIYSEFSHLLAHGFGFSSLSFSNTFSQTPSCTPFFIGWFTVIIVTSSAILHTYKHTACCSTLLALFLLLPLIIYDFLYSLLLYIGYSLAEALTYAATVLVVIINFILQYVLYILNRAEKHSSVSNEQGSYMFKIFISQYIIMAVVALVAFGKIEGLPAGIHTTV